MKPLFKVFPMELAINRRNIGHQNWHKSCIWNTNANNAWSHAHWINGRARQWQQKGN